MTGVVIGFHHYISFLFFHSSDSSPICSSFVFRNILVHISLVFPSDHVPGLSIYTSLQFCQLIFIHVTVQMYSHTYTSLHQFTRPCLLCYTPISSCPFFGMLIKAINIFISCMKTLYTITPGYLLSTLNFYSFEKCI